MKFVYSNSLLVVLYSLLTLFLVDHDDLGLSRSVIYASILVFIHLTSLGMLYVLLNRDSYFARYAMKSAFFVLYTFAFLFFISLWVVLPEW